MKQSELTKILMQHNNWLDDSQSGECANLQGADLSDANLSDTNLRHADLRYANLIGANLLGADLSGTCLDPDAPIPTIPDSEIVNNAGLEIQTVDNEERVYGWRTETSQHAGNTHYVPKNEPYEAPVFSVDTDTSCHPGIYLASENWLAHNYYVDVPLVRCYCLRSELIHAGDKWRCKRLWVIPTPKETS